MRIILFILLLFSLGCAYLPETYNNDAWALRYNYIEDEWEYAGPDERLRYNYMENKWEYSK